MVGDRWAAIAALAVFVACSHHDDSPSRTKAPPKPAPAATPVANGPVTVVDLSPSQGFLLGAGADDIYVGKIDPSTYRATLVRRSPAGAEDQIGESVHGFTMTDDAVYWTEPGLDAPHTGGVWRAKRPSGAPEQLVRAANLPEKLIGSEHDHSPG